jgi:hypothetical protein
MLLSMKLPGICLIPVERWERPETMGFTACCPSYARYLGPDWQQKIAKGFPQTCT